MAKELSDILVVADMDGTLLDDNMNIPQCNIENIRLFTAMGGRFTVGTGRIPESVERYPELLPHLSPAITCGGCVLYDFAEGRVLRSHLVPRAVAKRAIDDILHAFPSAGAAIVADDGRKYQVSASREMDGLYCDENLNFYARPLEDMPKNWVKVLFAAPAQTVEKMQKFTADRDYPGTHFVTTQPRYYEILPTGASKGNALIELCAQLGVVPENTYVIGDYYNDIDMMEKAGHAVAMGNAPADIQMLAGEVTGTNREGGVGQFLYNLIKQYE